MTPTKDELIKARDVLDNSQKYHDGSFYIAIRTAIEALEAQIKACDVQNGWRDASVFEPPKNRRIIVKDGIAIDSDGNEDESGEAVVFYHQDDNVYMVATYTAYQSFDVKNFKYWKELDDISSNDDWERGYICCLANAATLEDWRPSQIAGGLKMTDVIRVNADEHDREILEKHWDGKEWKS